MIISLLKEKQLRKINLPINIVGNYWITDIDDNGLEQNLINIEADNNRWKLISNNDYFYLDDNNCKQSYIYLENGRLYRIKNGTNNSFIYFICSDSNSFNFGTYDISNYLGKEIVIGRNANCNILYDIPDIGDVQLKIVGKDNYFYLENYKGTFSNYLNGQALNKNRFLQFGDVVFILGLRIIYIYYNNKPFLLIDSNNLKVKVSLGPSLSLNFNQQQVPYIEDDNEIDLSLYGEDEYFHRQPRFIQTLSGYQVNIDAPPNRVGGGKEPFLLTVGPMLTMSLTSLVSLYSALNNVYNKNATWASVAPSLVTCGVMFLSMLGWPLIRRAYTKKKNAKYEKLRQTKYREYIASIRNNILNEKNRQRQILFDMNPSLDDCEKSILSKKMILWQRRRNDEDFLNISLGVGNIPMLIEIKFPEQHFSLEVDDLLQLVYDLGNEKQILENVPISFSLRKNKIVGLIGNEDLITEFAKRCLLQLVTLHSYEILKIVIMTNEENEYKWEDFKILPHCWNNDKSCRYFSVDNEEHKEVCYNLEQVIFRNDDENKGGISSHYIIITDSFRTVRNFDFVKNILNTDKDIDVNLLILNSSIQMLPDQCETFINISDVKGELFNNILNKENTSFKIDFTTPIDFRKCIKALANVPIDIDSEEIGNLPQKVEFLELYGVGKIEQLNCRNRWLNNVPITSLQAPVGYGKSGEKISLDLHEKYHGPHGLIAGMTGSGKSEFIITYILSMAINYHPHEVQFILIDYKGGGLAGAFEKENMNIKLPHLVGTITNLDKNEIKRSLASIESELKRRQRLFNAAREASGESTIDIYKYQRMYRDHVIDVPCSHLFIISDEFAELKNQEPEFMNQLIQTARIGRSLGVHLILATQKPSGIVDAQIWSNTRFRVCLRVQDKSDSTEVIKCPDAAFLKDTGRFYLQVGYNEIFSLGQAAWAGAQYYPSEKIQKKIDSSIKMVNNIGYVVKQVDNTLKNANQVSHGEQLTNIVNYLCQIAREDNIVSTPLWLPKISDSIYLENLKVEYKYVPVKYKFTPVIGKYDDPQNQYQGLACIDLNENGNTIIYGMAGSGEDMLVNAIVYSLMVEHSPNEINIYMVDCGSETLRMFKDFPHIGDVAFLNESEKIENLFKMIMEMIGERKKILINYNGSYDYYCSNCSGPFPAVVLIINNYDNFKETYESLEDNIKTITRDCMKYGIFVILTANTINTVRTTIKQNFSNFITLQMADNTSYSYVFGNVNKMEPSKIDGRGLFKKDGIFEFQTGKICDNDKLVDYIANLAVKFKNYYSYKALRIPVLPEVITRDMLIDNNSNLGNFPIGIAKESLEILYFDFMSNPISLVMCQYMDDVSKFLPAYIEMFKLFTQVAVLDCEKILENNNYITDNFDKVLENILNFEDNGFGKLQYLCIIVGLDKLNKSLGMDMKNKLSELMNKASTESNIIRFLVVGSVDTIKPLEYESWFKSNVDNTSGIWVGSGIDNQFLLKVNSGNRETKAKISTDFGFVVKKGNPVLVKLVSSNMNSDNN